MYKKYSEPELINLSLGVRWSLGAVVTVADELPALIWGFSLRAVIEFLQCLLTILLSCPETARDLAGWSHGNGLVYFSTNIMR